MSLAHKNTPVYDIAEYSRDDTPARLIEVSSWPKRDSIKLDVAYNEWFDWSALFSMKIETILTEISAYFMSDRLFLAGVLTDASQAISERLNVIEIPIIKLNDVYFKAIWDDRSMLPAGPLAAAARMAAVWDSSQRWLIVNDRFYELGLFASFSPLKYEKCFFKCLDRQDLLERFSRIFRVTKIAGLSELEKWS
jgi:hypothetical protein